MSSTVNNQSEKKERERGREKRKRERERERERERKREREGERDVSTGIQTSENNDSWDYTEVDIQLKPRHFSVKRKARQRPLFSRENVVKEKNI